MYKIITVKYIAALLFFLMVAGTYSASAQCDFHIEASTLKHSDCQSNGIIKATLWGPDVVNGNIDLSDAKYGIVSLITGYVQTPAANNGIITNVPPGIYMVIAQGYCSLSHTWVTKTYSSVTIRGTYVVPDINKIFVVSADIQSSLACAHTGMIPIKMEGGKPPYTVKMSTYPAGYLGPYTFTQPTEGTLNIPGLPPGTYSFEISDDCTYTIHGIQGTVGQVNPNFLVSKVVNTPVCQTTGAVTIDVSDGVGPYTIEIVAPSACCVGNTYSVASDGSYEITGLPAGGYTFKVSDVCYTANLTATIISTPLAVTLGQVSSSLLCDGKGSINIDITGGLAPYTISITAHPAGYGGSLSFTQNTTGTFSLTNLPAGNYGITITDACGTSRVLSAITINVDHLTVGLVSTTNTNSTCTTKGKAVISVNKGKAPYSLNLISTPPAGYVNPSPVAIPAATNNHTIPSLPQGTYKFEVTDGCGEKDTVDFTIGVDPMTATVTDIIHSLNCEATGSLKITVNGGEPPYSVVMTSHTSTPPYTGPTSGFTPTAPNGNVFIIEDLPPGTYNFTITDACGVTTTVQGIIPQVLTDFPVDFYEDYFLPPASADPNCSKYRIKRRKNVSGSLGYYWNQHARDYYEVVFIEDNDPNMPPPIPNASWVWRPIDDVVDTVLSRTYCQMRNANGYVLAVIRLKNDVGLLCGYAIDTIRIKPVKTTLDPPYGQSCSGFNIRFQHGSGADGLFCYPYSWKLLRMDNSVVKSGSNINTSAKQTVTGIPYGKYVFEFTDKEGCSWKSDTLEYYWSPVPTATIATIPSCFSYKAEFTINAVCPPFDWRLLNPANTPIASKTNVTSTGIKESVSNLTFGVNYTLEVIYNAGNDTTRFTINTAASLYYNYGASYEPSFCLPDTAKGAIFIHRSNTMPNFEPGSVITFVSGPTTPTHTSYTVLNGGIDKVYPFGADPLTKSYESILPGIYTFQLTDSCSVVHPLTVNYEISSLVNFSYTRDSVCAGALIYPTGTIYLGATALPTYFRIHSAPPGIAVDTASVTTPGSLFLPESGKYVIQVSTQNHRNSCPYDTIAINYAKLSVSLDADSTEAYVCRVGDIGYIKVVRKGGIGPFEYELFDNGVSQGTNNHGVFHYGVPGATYIVRIKDLGCRVSFDQPITMVNLSNERLIYGSEDCCIGSVLELNSVPINSHSYSWVGPNGFTSSSANPRILNAGFPEQGVYTLTIHPDGCTSPIQQQMTVTIHDPPLPTATPQNILCLNSAPTRLEAISAAGHTLKWYDTDTVTVLHAAPAPPTHTVDTLTYFVSQVNDLFGCESPKIPVAAIINDLPSSNFETIAPVVCPGMYPTIQVPNSVVGYTYTLYLDPTGGPPVGMTVSVGDTARIKSTIPISFNTTFYVEVKNLSLCAAAVRKPASVRVENYLYIKPDKIPSYTPNEMYSVQLQSNAVSPYTYSSSFIPFGFNLSTQGLISGMAPGDNANPTRFTINLVDANGCVASKDYFLGGGPFVPEVFTPNGDGYNDIFMRGNHVIIFDRLGVVIFEGQNGWDGTRNGKPAPADTYFYILDYKEKNGSITVVKGYITLLKR